LVSLLVLLASCTAPNPDFYRSTLSGGSPGIAGTFGGGGEPGLPSGTGGSFPYGTGGVGGTDIDSSPADGGLGDTGGGSPGEIPDAQNSDGPPAGTGGSGGSPAADARVDSSTPVVDANPAPVDQRVDAAAGPDLAQTVDGSTPAPDAVVDLAPPPMDTAPVLDVAASTPDTMSTSDATTMSMTNGLRADYYDGQNFETFVFTRIDQVVNFSWVKTGPDPRLGEDNFSVRWTGYVEPRYTGTYTFSTVTDDGARLWIDGVNYIDQWTTQSGVEHTAVVNLIANRRYAIRMEFFDRAYTGSAQLFWRSTQQAKEIVPYTRLWTP
jgi:hypothetical protein